VTLQPHPVGGSAPNGAYQQNTARIISVVALTPTSRHDETDSPEEDTQ